MNQIPEKDEFFQGEQSLFPNLGIDRWKSSLTIKESILLGQKKAYLLVTVWTAMMD